MYRKYVYNTITWYDLHNPTPEELKELATLYELDGSAVKSLMSQSHSNNFRALVGYEQISLHVPCCIQTRDTRKIDRKCMNFLLAQDYVLSVRFADIKGIKRAKKMLQKDKSLDSAHDIFACLSEQIFASIDKDILRSIPQIAKDGTTYDHKKYVTDYSRTVRRNESVLQAYEQRHGDQARRSLDSLEQSIKNIDSQKMIQVNGQPLAHSGLFSKIRVWLKSHMV